MQSTKRASNSQPEGSSTKHTKTDAVDIVEIDNVNDATPQGSFIKLKVDTLCKIYPNDLDPMTEKDRNILEDKKEVLSFTILVRPLFKEMITLLETRIGMCKRIIMGPPGCGKSTSLYQIAQYCKLAKWIVFYLPDCIDLMFDTNSPKANETCENILRKLLKVNREIFENFEVPFLGITFREFIEKAIKEENCQNCLLKLISKLCTFDEGPNVLFAFDSWNKLLQKETVPNAIVETIAYWTSFTVSNGVAFFSTTSSFNTYSGQIKLNVFPGASAETQSNFLWVKPFDKNETEFFWKYMKITFPNNNTNVNDLKFDDIFKLTGCVPRHIKNLYMDKYDGCNTFDELLNTLEERFTSYYRKKIKCVFDHCLEGTRRYNIKFISDVAFNRYNSPLKPTDDFFKSGLFSKERNGEPLCPMVTRAAFSLFYEEDNSMEYIENIAKDCSIQWRAVELFTVRSFIREKELVLNKNDGKSIILDGRALNVIYQNRDQWSSNASKLDKGSMIVCAPGHKAVDLVILTENNYLLFIQISTAFYSQHISKREDLFNHFYTENGNSVSVIEHYCKLASKAVPKNETDFTKSKNIYYFYITTSNQQKSNDEHVHILNEENFFCKLNSWNIIRSNFTKSSK